jgi:hypothetical protein
VVGKAALLRLIEVLIKASDWQLENVHLNVHDYSCDDRDWLEIGYELQKSRKTMLHVAISQCERCHEPQRSTV